MNPVAPWSMVKFRAMGSPCRIVAPTHELARYGQELVVELEATWSRFDLRSEISGVNEQAGNLSIVSAVTYELIALAEHARTATCGVFNPLMLDQLVALGYDRTWNEMVGVQGSMPASASAVDRPDRAVPGDVGGSASCGHPIRPRWHRQGHGGGHGGRCAPRGRRRVRSDRTRRGCSRRRSGVDRRVMAVQLDDSDHGVPHPATITLTEGGVATSSVVRRRWRRGSVDVHHLIDARTGRPASTDLDSVTTAAPTLWWAEVVAKSAVIVGSCSARELLEQYEMTGVLVGPDPNNPYELIQRGTVAA